MTIHELQVTAITINVTKMTFGKKFHFRLGQREGDLLLLISPRRTVMVNTSQRIYVTFP